VPNIVAKQTCGASTHRVFCRYRLCGGSACLVLWQNKSAEGSTVGGLCALPSFTDAAGAVRSAGRTGCDGGGAVKVLTRQGWRGFAVSLIRRIQSSAAAEQ
jgi:hypothetical protein